MTSLPDHKRGNTWDSFKIHSAVNGIPVDVTDIDILIQFRKDINGAVAFQFSTKEGTIVKTDPLNGEYELQSRVMNYESKKYFFDIKFFRSDGTNLTTSEIMSFTITDVITM